MKVSDKLIKFLESILSNLKKNDDKAKVNESFNNNQINGNNLFSNNRKNVNKTINNYNIYKSNLNDDMGSNVTNKPFYIRFLNIILLLISLCLGMFILFFILDFYCIKEYYLIKFLKDYKVKTSISIFLILVLTKLLNYKINKIHITPLNILGNIIICITPFSLMFNKILNKDFNFIEHINYADYYFLLIGCFLTILIVLLSIKQLFERYSNELSVYWLVVTISILSCSGWGVDLITYTLIKIEDVWIYIYDKIEQNFRNNQLTWFL